MHLDEPVEASLGDVHYVRDRSRSELTFLRFHEPLKGHRPYAAFVYTALPVVCAEGSLAESFRLSYFSYLILRKSRSPAFYHMLPAPLHELISRFAPHPVDHGQRHHYSVIYLHVYSGETRSINGISEPVERSFYPFAVSRHLFGVLDPVV